MKEAIRRGADKTFELAIRPDTTKTAEGEPVLSARKLGFFYDRSQIPVFRDLNLSVAAGQTVAVIGGNGAGKSTLLKLFCGVLEPSAGAVEKRVESTGIFRKIRTII